MPIPTHLQSFWISFLKSSACPADANDRFLESFRIGSSAEEADHGVKLILSGKKTATSSLLWEYEQSEKTAPTVGSLSVVENGNSQPICVVKTTWIEINPISNISEDFAYDYGELDGTLTSWHRVFDNYYAQVCAEMGCDFTDNTPLVCERFKLIYNVAFD
ncbi:MAG: ASCH domain-containing protein [Granulosicoccus sp.]|nr:ASCH domain-containing protein [Granulosicoccus sp.]